MAAGTGRRGGLPSSEVQGVEGDGSGGRRTADVHCC